MFKIHPKHSILNFTFRKRVTFFIVFLLLLTPPGFLSAGSPTRPEVDHPIVKPHVYTKHRRCTNCGMKLNMWARTRHAFTLSSGEYHTCSIHCVADIARQQKESPKDVEVALYLEPETMIASEKASYVVGSMATGTMTAVSKIAFPTETAAGDFAGKYGGTVMNFTDALDRAAEEL